MYGVTVEDIYKLNPGSRETIRIGDTLQIPQPTVSPATAGNDADDHYLFHTIQPKETLYSLTVRYDVPASSILEANPGLSVETFRIGKTIRIPKSMLEDIPQSEFRTVVRWVDYRIPKRETLYNITRKYNIPSDELIRANPQLKDGVKEGMVIQVPIQTDEPVNSAQAVPRERDVNALLNRRPTIDRVNMVKVALLLPFMTEEATPSDATSRFIEYYEGLLLAVDSLKNKGVSIELSVFDTGNGTATLPNIFRQEVLQDANLIIGGVQNDQIAQIAHFAREKGIKHVIPFTSRNDDVLSNAAVLQVNTPQSYLFAKAARTGCDLFANYNIIILNVEDKDQKTEFIQSFKTELNQRNIPFREVSHTASTFQQDIRSALSADKRNVIVPTSGSLEALNKFRSVLRGIVDSDTNLKNSISLFGYPEWQTYVADCLDDFYALDTYIYTSFYADNLSWPVKEFYQKFTNWYSKLPGNTYPKYSILGFDTGMFFINAVKTYGSNFEENLGKIRYESLQTGFQFERVNNWGGFINTNLFIVHYNKIDYSVTRREIR